MKTFYGIVLAVCVGYFGYAMQLQEVLGSGLSPLMRNVYVATIVAGPVLLVTSGIQAIRPIPGFSKALIVVAALLALCILIFVTQ